MADPAFTSDQPVAVPGSLGLHPCRLCNAGITAGQIIQALLRCCAAALLRFRSGQAFVKEIEVGQSSLNIRSQEGIGHRFLQGLYNRRGVAVGTITAYSTSSSNYFSPCSATVGTCGASRER
jgi:hypothetical protein